MFEWGCEEVAVVEKKVPGNKVIGVGGYGCVEYISMCLGGEEVEGVGILVVRYTVWCIV